MQIRQPPHLVRCSGRSWTVAVQHKVDVTMEALVSLGLLVPRYTISFYLGFRFSVAYSHEIFSLISAQKSGTMSSK